VHPSSPVRFYLDFISHNAYIAWEQIHPMAERYGRGVEAVPVLFAGLLNAHGQLGPAEVPPKAWWMAKNLLRKAKILGIPLGAPTSHPFNPLLALRVASLPMEEPDRKRLVDVLFRAVWAGGPGVTDPAEVTRVVREAGLDGEKLVADAHAPEAKERLRRQTEEAISAGVFGVPSMEVEGEIFWGYDDFPYLERFLSGDDPLDRKELESWMRIRPSAVRRRPKGP
jgi:2-hydroxychromene-2-carboxylate isomerase